MTNARTVEFDLDRYLRNSKKVDLSGIEWDEIPQPRAVGRRRDVPPLHDGHRGAHGHLPARPARHARRRRSADHRVSIGVGNGLGIVPTMLGSALARDLVAIHMMWGAVNELTTLTGYYALIRRSDHPVLHQLLHKVIQDGRRHFAFYRAQAKARMERSRAARRMVRWALKALWTPVGAGVKSEEEVDALGLYLFADGPEGREHAVGIDETISAVPGLEGLTLIQDYLDAAERREEERAAHMMRIGS